MRHVGSARIGVLLVVMTLTASACGGTGGVTDGSSIAEGGIELPVEADGSTETIVLDGDGGTSGSAGDGGSWGDLCDAVPQQHGYLVEIGLLEEDDLAELPVPFDFQLEGYWTVGPLGSDGAWAVGESLTNGEWLCDLEPTPEIVAALGELDEETITEMSIDELAGIVAGDGEGGANTGDGGGLDVSSLGELRQEVRDLLSAVALAQRLGDLDTADALMDAARDVFAGYAEIVKNEAHDPAELLAVVAEAQLLDLDDLADEVYLKVEEIVEGRLADAAKLFTPCTTDPNVIRLYFEALGRVQMVAGYASSGLAAAWIDVQERREAGDEVHECEGAVFDETTALDGWDGTLRVYLTTCGYMRWTGKITASGTLVADGATMTLESEMPLVVVGDPATGDFAGLFEITLTAPEATGEGQTVLYGTAFLELSGGEVELTLFFDRGLFDMTITAAGMTVTQSREIGWEPKVITGPITPLDALCTPEG